MDSLNPLNFAFVKNHDPSHHRGYCSPTNKTSRNHPMRGRLGIASSVLLGPTRCPILGAGAKLRRLASPDENIPFCFPSNDNFIGSFYDPSRWTRSGVWNNISKSSLMFSSNVIRSTSKTEVCSGNDLLIETYMDTTSRVLFLIRDTGVSALAPFGEGRAVTSGFGRS